MRYRKLSTPNPDGTGGGDMMFGRGSADFWVDQVEAPAQAIATRLKLFVGEWWLNTAAGTAWIPEGVMPGAPGQFYGVVGMHTQGIYDQIIQERIRNTPGVARIVSYQSQRDPRTRRLSVSATVLTIYGPAPVRLVVPYMPPMPPPALDQFILAEAAAASPLDGTDALLLGSNEPVGPL